MLSLKNVACRRASEPLFTGVDLAVYRGQKIGVTGANGCGKSSLFGLILGQLEPDDGEIEFQQGIRIVHVEQETRSSDRVALEYVIDGDQQLRTLERRIEDLQQQHDAGQQLATALTEYEQIGAYSAAARAGALLYGLGFDSEQQQWRVNDFSGGWRVRLNLARALMSPGDLLLLDEPTNHLDLNAVIWLEQWLQRFDGTLLLISHDRDFLDHTIKSILHIEAGQARLYGGNYSTFERLRAEHMANQQQAYERQQRKVQDIQRFVDRFRAKASKAKQAQSRLKMLSRMTEISPAHIDSGFEFNFQKPDHLPDPLVRFEAVSAGYESLRVLESVNWTLNCGDRIGLLGRNGAGKSTLLKTLVGDLPILAGERTASQHLRMGYFAQHQIDQLQYEKSALDHLLAQAPEYSDQAARNFLGGYGFHGDQVLKPVKVLSGGEKARLALALVVEQKPNLLLLDEPTNHLDLSMRQALAEALQAFVGALIVISHDRFLLNSVVDQFLLVDQGRLQYYDDDLDGYARWLSQNQQPETAIEDTSKAPAPNRKLQKQLEAQHRQKLQPLQKKQDALERKTRQLSLELAEVREKLSDNQLYSNEHKSRLSELLQTEAGLKTALAEAEEAWLMAMDELEQARMEGN